MLRRQRLSDLYDVPKRQYRWYFRGARVHVVHRSKVRQLCYDSEQTGPRPAGRPPETGKVRPVIERTYNLDDAPETLRHLDAGRARGKVVITVERDNKS